MSALFGSPRQILVGLLPLVLALQALWRPIGTVDGRVLEWSAQGALLPFASAAVAAAVLVLWPLRRVGAVLVFVALAGLGAVAPLALLARQDPAAPPAWDAGFWLYAVALALLAGASLRRVAFWQRANKWGAVCGMSAGLGLTCWYMATTQPWLRGVFNVTSPIALWWGIQPISAGVVGDDEQHVRRALRRHDARRPPGLGLQRVVLDDAAEGRVRRRQLRVADGARGAGRSERARDLLAVGDARGQDGGQRESRDAPMRTRVTWVAVCHRDPPWPGPVAGWNAS